MSCERYAEAITDHACGADLPPEAAAHLRSCATCTAMLVERRTAIGALDGEIQNVLAIEPSPYFVERVQAHVRETSPAAPWWRWALAAAAAIVILAIAGSFALRSGPPPTVARAPQPSVVTPAPAPPVAVPPSQVEKRESERPPDETLSRRHLPRQPATRGAAPRTAMARAQPEVIVPAEQARAVARYLALVRSGQVDTSTLAAPEKVAAELDVAPLAVDPLAVRPLEPGINDDAIGVIPNKEQNR
jgi:hypothetical protein